MTEIQGWAAAMCAIGIGCTLMSMLCPSGAVRRTFGTLTAVFFLCCLLTPIKTLIGQAVDLFAVREQTAVSRPLDETVNAQAQEVIAAALLRDAEQRLSETATVKKVTVYRDNTRADSIYIERVRVTLSQEDRTVGATVRKALEQAWGTVVEVYYVG